ncbi:bifunctional Methioninyl-tRNA synthetase core domain/Aminoacyl-tRNA synthetase [Babesia duncani]|uniref:methionine--tRNA ligase n=1 Tax=Babesia duncani TaxID=323732 RepID=A0AAD9UQR7_9APIC|nr:bifunctional Methioninyl-tRNA synthetase core domain/Aminoacyl-tRNA synthetase [Babesia duncani]
MSDCTHPTGIYLVIIQLVYVIFGKCEVYGFRCNNAAPATNGIFKQAAISAESPRNGVHVKTSPHASTVDEEQYLITSPLFYLNSEPHIGHAYTVVAADVIKRFKLMQGQNAKLLVGTDEHGTKIEQAANAIGKTPIEHVNYMRSKFLEMFSAYNVSADVFVHSSDEAHKKKVKGIFDHLLKKGDIYEGLHRGYFSPKEDLYYPQSQLVNGKSPQGFDVIEVAEHAYFFKLSKWQQELKHLLYSNPDFIIPSSRYNEALMLLEGPLPDVAITRRNCKWGIKINDEDTIYVWFDALLGYLHDYTIGDCGEATSEDGNVENGIKAGFGNTFAYNAINVLGKDILRFHALLWPALLLSLGLNVPKQLIVHGWLLNKGEKISKSKGPAIPAVFTENSDVARFTLMTFGAFGDDLNYNNRRLKVAKSQIVDLFANACHRLTGLLEQRQIVEIQPPSAPDPRIADIIEMLSQLEIDVQVSRLDMYINHVCDIAAQMNKYQTEQELWNVMDEKQFRKKAHIICQGLTLVAFYIWPVMPNVATCTLNRLNPIFHGSINGHVITTKGFQVIENIKNFTFRPVHGDAIL